MAATPSTTAEKMAPLALYCVAQHMLDRKLPAPQWIKGPRPGCSAEKRVEIALFSSALDEWLDSLIVDDEHHRPLDIEPSMGRWEVVEYDGRIPTAIGDVAVVVKVTRQSRLTLVGGASA